MVDRTWGNGRLVADMAILPSRVVQESFVTLYGGSEMAQVRKSQRCAWSGLPAKPERAWRAWLPSWPGSVLVRVVVNAGIVE